MRLSIAFITAFAGLAFAAPVSTNTASQQAIADYDAAVREIKAADFESVFITDDVESRNLDKRAWGYVRYAGPGVEWIRYVEESELGTEIINLNSRPEINDIAVAGNMLCNILLADTFVQVAGGTAVGLQGLHKAVKFSCWRGA